MPESSSANPFKLGRYSTDGMAMAQTLQTTATSLSSALGTLRGTSSPYLPSIGTPDETVTDLAGDWFHLDEFVGDVANGMMTADVWDNPPTQAQMESMVVTVNDDTIASRGQVGYADRDQAIADATQLAEDAANVVEDGLSPEELQALTDRAARGQFDPAFAVAFSEAAGVDGYADIVGTIRAVYEQSGNVPPEGIAMVEVWSQTLTTALDTMPGIESVDLHDLSNAGLAEGDRIDPVFVQSLTTDWYASGSTDPTKGTEFDLSVLMSFADPPTAVAVEMAFNRTASRLLDDHYPWDTNMGGPVPWGDNGGLVTNYMTMLGSNDDASAQFLNLEVHDGSRVIDHVLRRPSDYNVDGGQALATVVDNAVTHWDDDLREPVMVRAIDQFPGELHNPYMAQALANGVDSNMDLIVERATAVDLASPGEASGAADELMRTHDFLKVLMADTDAAATIYAATLDYAHDALSGTTGDSLSSEARDLGSLFALVTEADIHAEIESAEERAARRAAFIGALSTVTDTLIGRIPGSGALVTAGKKGLGWAAGELSDAFRETDDVSQAYDDVRDYRIAMNSQLTTMFAVVEYVDGTWTSDEVQAAVASAELPGDTDFFVDGTSGATRPIKPLSEMSETELHAFEEWVGSDDVIDVVGPIRTEAGQWGDEVREVVND